DAAAGSRYRADRGAASARRVRPMGRHADAAHAACDAPWCDSADARRAGQTRPDLYRQPGRCRLARPHPPLAASLQPVQRQQWPSDPLRPSAGARRHGLRTAAAHPPAALAAGVRRRPPVRSRRASARRQGAAADPLQRRRTRLQPDAGYLGDSPRAGLAARCRSRRGHSPPRSLVAGAQPMSASIDVAWLRVGSCRHLACMAARGAGLHQVDFPSYCALLRHPTRGWMLYDTGYAPHFFQATAKWPERLYGRMLPVSLPPQECLSTQLAARGIRREDIGAVIVSHFHADHVAGLRDFPQARIIALRAESEHVLALRGRRWRATVQGRLPGMLPDDFATRLEHADDCPQRSLPAW